MSLPAKIVGELATWGSLVALVFSLHPADASLSAWQIVLITLATVAGAVSIAIDGRSYRNREILVFRNRRAEIDFWNRWIEDSGLVVICTRDLSWGTDDKLRAALHRKAAGRDLIILFETSAPLLVELGAAGGVLVDYGSLGFDLQSRFTIANYGRSDMRVAVAMERGLKPAAARLTGEQSGQAVSLARDVAEILRRSVAHR